MRDDSPATIQAALPALRAIADATQAPDDLGVLARTLASDRPGRGRTAPARLTDPGGSDENFRLASAAAGDLINLLGDGGRLREALDLANKRLNMAIRLGWDPGISLLAEGS